MNNNNNFASIWLYTTQLTSMDNDWAFSIVESRQDVSINSLSLIIPADRILYIHTATLAGRETLVSVYGYRRIGSNH